MKKKRNVWMLRKKKWLNDGEFEVNQELIDVRFFRCHVTIQKACQTCEGLNEETISQEEEEESVKI
jgi:hypothetical protein